MSQQPPQRPESSQVAQMSGYASVEQRLKYISECKCFPLINHFHD